MKEEQWYIYLQQKKSLKHFQLLMCKNISPIIEIIIIHILLQTKRNELLKQIFQKLCIESKFSFASDYIGLHFFKPVSHVLKEHLNTKKLF